MEDPRWKVRYLALSKRCEEALAHGRSLDSIVSVIQRLERGKRGGVVVIAGAGMSTSAGLPAFRGGEGLFEQIRRDYPDVREPSDVSSITPFLWALQVQPPPPPPPSASGGRRSAQQSSNSPISPPTIPMVPRSMADTSWLERFEPIATHLSQTKWRLIAAR